MLGEKKDQVTPCDNNARVTLFCDLPKFYKCGLVTGYYNSWHGKSKETLKNNTALFSVNFLNEEALADGDFDFDRKKFSRVAFNDFEPISDEIILNFDFKPRKNVQLLKTPKMMSKLMVILAKHSKQLRNESRKQRNELRVIKQDVNVCYIPKETNIPKIYQQNKIQIEFA